MINIYYTFNLHFHSHFFSRNALIYKSQLYCRLMQARDREPLRCIQNCTPTHASSMPELPPPPRPSSGASMSTSTAGAASAGVLSQEPATSPANPGIGASQTDPPTPTSRRVRFQGDLDVNDHSATSRIPLSPTNDRNSSSSPSPTSLSRTNVSRSRSLQPEEVASTSWGKILVLKKMCG